VRVGEAEPRPVWVLGDRLRVREGTFGFLRGALHRRDDYPRSSSYIVLTSLKISPYPQLKRPRSWKRPVQPAQLTVFERRSEIIDAAPAIIIH
jgi:hypothetical protein